VYRIVNETLPERSGVVSNSLALSVKTKTEAFSIKIFDARNESQTKVGLPEIERTLTLEFPPLTEYPVPIPDPPWFPAVLLPVRVPFMIVRFPIAELAPEVVAVPVPIPDPP
jgi:hypothetical protein